ncbi:hypothetical protein [Chitinophaga ginsengisoli]|uniref:hypothetical protein n=1 Tax=Chitinophaga ginsengisoli TaxID=363837 RepID=UPI0011B20BE1|nr:hypothetical protein [Chitinophaga ginsengisoli]
MKIAGQDYKLEKEHRIVKPKIVFQQVCQQNGSNTGNNAEDQVIVDPFSTFLKLVRVNNKGDQKQAFDPQHNVKKNDLNVHLIWV